MPAGHSRSEPPILERDLPTVAAPGLAYAVARGPIDFDVEFLSGERAHGFRLPLPRLDAAFVLKAALVASGARTKSHHLMRDTVDAVMLAAACAADDEAVAALRSGVRIRGTGREEVRAAIRWLGSALETPESAGARRLDAHFGDDATSAWGVQVAAGLTGAVGDG